MDASLFFFLVRSVYPSDDEIVGFLPVSREGGNAALLNTPSKLCECSKRSRFGCANVREHGRSRLFRGYAVHQPPRIFLVTVKRGFQYRSAVPSF